MWYSQELAEHLNVFCYYNIVLFYYFIPNRQSKNLIANLIVYVLILIFEIFNFNKY